jgi:pimeloyl-ACP methyl ester carboxylesterase
MKKITVIAVIAVIVSALLQNSALYAQVIKPAQPPAGFESRYAKVNGITLHYVTGGKGEPLVLIHGFGENWYVWNRLLPILGEHFTVIVPELRGVGESDKPEGGYNKKTMATDIHELVKQLHFNKASVVGHDIGLMVAYSYAAQFRSEVKKLVMMEATIPGADPYYTEGKKSAWWWGFFSWPHSAELVAGKEEFFITEFWKAQAYLQNRETREEMNEFVRAYKTPGAITSSFKWFAAFTQDEKDNAVLMQHPLQMPVMVIGGDKHDGPMLEGVIKVVAPAGKMIMVKDGGHWLMQERPEETKAMLLDFLVDK